MNGTIDTRGIDGEKSWSMIKERIAGFLEGRFTTVTDNPDTVCYIRKRAEDMGIKTQLEEMGGEYYLHFANQTRLSENEKKQPAKNMVIVVTGDTLGRGEEALGKALMKGYFYNLKWVKPYPKAIIFLNRGVFLTTQGSEVLEDIKTLWEYGIDIVSSSTCLDYYNRKQLLLVGGVTGMREIVEKMAKGENTVVL